MFWLIFIAFLLLFTCWILLSPFELEIDTAIPRACLKWKSLGSAEVIYENERWLLGLDIFFYHNKWPLGRAFRKRQRRKSNEPKRTGKPNFQIPLSRIPGILSSFRVKEWRLALDANESLHYVMAYPLNFFPNLSQHVQINFDGVTYFRIRISNRAWRLVYAWVRH